MVLCVNHVKLPDVEMLLSSRYMSSLREFFFFLLEFEFVVVKLFSNAFDW